MPAPHAVAAVGQHGCPAPPHALPKHVPVAGLHDAPTSHVPFAQHGWFTPPQLVTHDVPLQNPPMGTRLGAVPPLPNCPSVLSPQHVTAPSDRSAHECAAPTAT